MTETRTNVLRALWAPKLVRVSALLVAGVAAYDSFSSQFGLPTLGSILGMSGSLLPWWGWLLILQTIFVYALFEYVRRIQVPGAYDDADLRERVETAIQTTARELQNLTETVEPALESQVLMNEAFERRMEGFEAISESVTGRLDEHRDWLRAQEAAQGEWAKRIETHHESRIDRLEGQIKKLDEKTARSLYAVRTKEALDQISTDIEEIAAGLYSPFASGDTCDQENWSKWEKTQERWLGLMRAWVEHGKWYFGDLTSAVMETPDHKYGGKWTVSDSQFPNAEAVRIFKKFRIIQTQWEGVKDKVTENLYYVAYYGMSDTEVRRGEPAK